MQYLKDVRVTEKAMLRFHAGTIGEKDVVALYSGVCKVNAAIAAQLLIDLFKVDVIVNAGVAGGMDPRVRIFDTVIAEKAIYHDVEEDILTDFHPWMRTAYFETAPWLVGIAKDCSAKAGRRIFFGTMVTGERFIDNAARDDICRRFSPLSADMETAAIAHVCHVNGVPFLAVRTITDTAEYDGEAHFEENCEKASQIAAEITVEIVERLPEL